MSYREWYTRRHDFSPLSEPPSPTSVAPDNEEVQRLSAFGTPYSPISEDEQATYVPRLRIIDSGSEAELSDSASDDGEEEEEVIEVPPPPSLSAHQRDIRAARRSCVRGAFHLALLFLFTVIIPSDATGFGSAAETNTRHSKITVAMTNLADGKLRISHSKATRLGADLEIFAK